MMAPAIVAAMLLMRMSLFLTWVSSCARTPVSSSSFRRRTAPRVTATDACAGFRPVAKAFGESFGMIYSFGMGIAVRAQRNSTMRYVSGACSLVTGWARYILNAILSEKK